MKRKKIRNLLICSLFLLSLSVKGISATGKANIQRKKITSVSADKSILGVKSYGFVDLEGAKTSAIIIEYSQEIENTSVEPSDYEIINYVIYEERLNGYENTIEKDGDDIKGNEGGITRIYVNNKPEISETGGISRGKYVIIEVDTAYMLKGQNLSYTSSMMAGARQVGEVKGAKNLITAGTKEISNYVLAEEEKNIRGSIVKQTVVNADKDKIILPEFGKGSGWNLHYVGKNSFKAINSYSEYTGKYESFELPYSIYVPGKRIMEKNKGNISLVIHMEHAGANDTDPMAAVTSSKAAVKLSGKKVQEDSPAIIIVPQIEEARRSTNDTYSSSEANTAVWQLIDSVLSKYKGYINESRIYGRRYDYS